MTIELVVTQLQQDLFTLRAQVAAESGLADAVRATAQVRKDTPSLIDVRGLGCPKEFSSREEDFQQWSKKMENKRLKPRRQLSISSSCPSETNVDREVQNLEFVSQQRHAALMAFTSFEPGDTAANSRKNPLEAWRRLQKRCDPTTRRRKRNLLRTIMSPGRCSLLELQAGIERWESYVSRHQEKLKDKSDDEIKLAGLEALVPEELEKHLILNSNRLRTFEDARLEVVTFVEAKFGLRNS